MLDFGHLPKPQNSTIDYFPGFSDTSGGQWEVWNKPRGCTFIRILCIGGGGGGGAGGGDVGTAGGDAAGGGGAASAGMTVVTIPAVFLPDRLYVSSGRGGPGSTTSAAGTTGSASYVAIAQSTVAIYVVCYANGGGGAGSGSNTNSISGGGGAGTAAVVATQANTLQGFQGHFFALAGQSGAAGGQNSGNGSGVAFPTTGLLLSGGAGGGCIQTTSSNGGSVGAPASQTTTYTLFQTIVGGTGGDSNPGGTGVELYQPLLSAGGAGGGAFSTLGGRGGDAGFGSGGGGGGAGSSLVAGTRGPGGAGGAGLIVIHTW